MPKHILIKPGDLKVPDWDGLRAHAIAGDTKQRAEGVLAILRKEAARPLFFYHPRWVGWRRCTRGCSMEAFPFRQLPSV